MPSQDNDDDITNNNVQQHLVGLPDDFEFCQPVNDTNNDNAADIIETSTDQPPTKKQKLTC